MAKSKYPQQLDTSAEIPAVRDNITEIGSDVINSLRSAIFKIEAALGINPQGAVGNTVSSRLNKSLDENGNILQDALERANVLSGPILDADVSKVAAIKESKLKLDYPTTLLQDEISILNSQLKTIRSALEEISLQLAIHLEPTALNSHTATSIGVEEAAVVAADIATLSLAAGTLQDTLEELYNAHINYTGANISSLNNSHLANQVYYDNALTSNSIFSNSVQGAIDDLVNVETVGFRNSLLNVTSNGRIRTGTVTDDFDESTNGDILVPLSSGTYIPSTGSSTAVFSLTTPSEPLGTISEYDILTLVGAENDEDNKSYQIQSVTIDGTGLLQEIIVYGGPKGNATSGLSIEISKNPYVPYNAGGFACVSRPRADKTNTPDVQYLNPDCATIISRNIIPSNILSTAHTFDIEIDGNSPITINTYDASLTKQSLDSIIQTINDQAVDQHLNFTAFKVRSNNCYELALAHNMPNITGDVVNRTLRVSIGSSNDGIAGLGLSHTLDINVEGRSGNSLNINGLILSQFGLVQEFSDANIEMVIGSLTLSLFSGTFSELGVRVGDLAIITGSSDPTDDGTYRIGSLSSGTLTLDLAGSSFSGYLESGGKIYILRSTAPVGEFTFEEIGTVNGTILFDVFMSEDKNVFQTKRLEVEDSLSDGPFTAAISDVSRGLITAGQTATLSVDTSGFATLTDPTLQTGEAIFVGSSGVYKVFASDGLSFVTLQVEASGPPTTAQSVTLFGFDEISSNNYHLCRGGFSTALGRILGTSTNPGIPTLIDKRKSGTADHTIISESFIERYIEGPRHELRGNGIIRGCEVVDVTYTDTGTEIYQTFSVSAGIAVINGIRFEFPGTENIRIDTSDTYIVAMDNTGCIIADPYIADPLAPSNEVSPFYEMEVAHLAEVNNDGVSSASVIDLRLFIDNLDYKVLGDIKVSNDPEHGHFTDISKAVAYSKRFAKMFPEMTAPTILMENGIYTVDETIIVDFDVAIKGSGPDTRIRKSAAFGEGVQLTGDDVDMSTAVFLIGGGQNENAESIATGVTLSDFTYQTINANINYVGTVIALTEPLAKGGSDVSRRAIFRFQNISFQGPSKIDGAAPDPDKIGEFAFMIGQQDPSTLAPESNLEMGSIIIQNCRFDRMGLEIGAIKFTESLSTIIKDVIVSNNIVTRASPNLGDISAIVIEYPTNPTLENIVEIGNTFRVAS